VSLLGLTKEQKEYERKLKENLKDNTLLIQKLAQNLP